MSTLRVFLVPILQCAVCGYSLRFDGPQPRADTTHTECYCQGCKVTVSVPLSFVDCEIKASDALRGK